MIRIRGNFATHCDGVTRRSFVQAGALGVGGLLLPEQAKIADKPAMIRSVHHGTGDHTKV